MYPKCRRRIAIEVQATRFCLLHQQVFKRMKGTERTRMLVRVRDGFACKDCGDVRTPEYAEQMGKRLHDVHHLLGLCGKRSKKYDKVADMDGLVTLCHKCHFNRPEHATKRRLHSMSDDQLLYMTNKYRKQFQRRKKMISGILRLRKQGKTFRQIGAKYSLTKQRIHQISRGIKLST